MTDKELLEKLKKDKNSGLSVVIELYSGLLYKVVAAVVLPLGSNEDVEECVSDSFLSFYRHIDSVDPEKASIKSYLAVIARRKAIDFCRRNKDKNSLSLEMLNENERAQESFVSDVERKKLLFEALKNLGEPDTTIVTRKYFFGETAAQIGEAVSLSEAAVQKRLERSREKLKLELGGVF